MLNKNQLKQLRSEITLNSMFMSDYSNTLMIKNKTVFNFFDSFIDYIYESSRGFDFYEILEKHDNIDEIYNYYIDSCIDGYDPLSPDDYIAYKNDTAFSGVVIYEINNGDFKPIITASYHLNKYGCMVIDKITSNRLYIDNIGDYYFIKNKKRYYLNDFMRVDR